MCGEQLDTEGVDGFASGSSPRVRGAACMASIVALSPWIIPACAGSSVYYLHHGSDNRDHPRVCGEQT